MMRLLWSHSAEESYFEEIDFILVKRPPKEAYKFIDLVENTIATLKTQPGMGKLDTQSGYYFYVLSKQTTLIYKFFKKEKTIRLHLFWNNQRNPDQLQKLLRS